MHDSTRRYSTFEVYIHILLLAVDACMRGLSHFEMWLFSKSQNLKVELKKRQKEQRKALDHVAA